jgi:hypothetical protein
MIEHSEEFGNLRIYQEQADGWIEGTYNTFITYSGSTLGKKYHIHESRKRNKENPDDGIYNLISGKDIMSQCSLYKDMLNDIAYLKIKMEVKIQRGITYNFDMVFIGDILKKTADAIHKKIESIYLDMQFESKSKGKVFNIPLPDYTTNNAAEDYTENDQRADITIKSGGHDEIIEQIKKDTDLIIELLKLKSEKTRPEYINDLIEEGYLKPNGKTALTGLDNITEFLSTRIENLTPQVLLQFEQSNGDKYSLRTAQDAIKRNKTQ